MSPCAALPLWLVFGLVLLEPGMVMAEVEVVVEEAEEWGMSKDVV